MALGYETFEQQELTADYLDGSHSLTVALESQIVAVRASFSQLRSFENFTTSCSGSGYGAISSHPAKMMRVAHVFLFDGLPVQV